MSVVIRFINLGLVILTTLTHALEIADQRPFFDYKSPESWSELFPTQCDASVHPIQSPINLSANDSIGVRLDTRLHLHGYHDVSPREMILTNDGNFLVMIPRYEGELESGAFITAGPLIKDRLYHLDHIMWHWSNQSSHGSEHKIDDRSSSMELQFIHYNKEKYSDLAEALKNEDGAVIVSFLFAETSVRSQEEEEDDILLDQFYSHLSQLQNPGSIIQLTPTFPMAELLKSSSSEINSNHQYYSYHGSLTTPPCHNSVTWIVFDTQIPIHTSHMAMLRKLKNYDGNFISKNSRPIQELQGRHPLRIKMI